MRIKELFFDIQILFVLQMNYTWDQVTYVSRQIQISTCTISHLGFVETEGRMDKWYKKSKQKEEWQEK